MELDKVIADRNQDTRDRWSDFEPHRRRVTDLLCGCFAEPQSVAALWGAGNCNDVDLAAVAKKYSTVHLVDIDANALQQSSLRHPQIISHLVQHAPVDVTGVFEPLSRVNPSDPNRVAALVTAARQAPTVVPHPAVDLAASMCLLTQIIDGFRMTLGDRHDQLLPLIEAARWRHLLMLLQSVRAGGAALLITDVVSSDTAPELQTVPDQELGDYLQQQIQQANFFTGLNPFRIMDLLRNDPMLTAHLAGLQLVRPWKWCLGERWYAVTAIKMIRS